MQILQILLVIISAIGNLWPFWTPIWCQGCPQKGPKFMICPKWETVSNLWWEIVSLYKFAASGGEGGTFREMGNFLTPRVPQKGSKLMICPKWGAVWNLWSKIISLQISSFCVIFRGMGVPKRVKICGLTKICHNRILHAKFCIHVKF